MSSSHAGGLGPLIDTHAHIYPRDTPLIEGATHRPSRDVTPEEFVRTLDEHGVLFGVHAAASFMGFDPRSWKAHGKHLSAFLCALMLSVD